MSTRFPRRAAAALALAGLMLSVAAPGLGQEETSTPDSVDLASILPAEVADMPVEAAEYPVTPLLADADPEDPALASTIEAFDALAAALEVEPEQLVVGSARAVNAEASRGVLLFTLRAEGVEGATALEPFIEAMQVLTPGYFAFADPAVEPVELEGKEVLLIGSELLQDGQYHDGDHVGLASGVYAMLLQGDEASVREIVAALP